MKPLFARTVAAAAAAAILLAVAAPPAVAQGDPLRLLVSNGLKGTMEALQRQCETEIGRRLAVQFSSTAALKQRIESGEAFDLTIITVEAIDDLLKRGLLKTPQKAIGRSELGVGIRAGDARPDIGTVAGFRQALRAAPSITYPRDGASRGHIEQTFERLGIATEVKPKIILADGSGPATESVAAGKAAMVLTLFSEIVPTHGAEILGPFPGEYQFDIRFAAATSAKSTQAAGASAVIDFLTGPKAAPVLKAKGIDAPR